MTESVIDLYGIDPDRLKETIEKLQDQASSVAILLQEMYRCESARVVLPYLREHSQELRRSQVYTFFVVLEGVRSMIAGALENFDTGEWFAETDSVDSAIEGLSTTGDALVTMIAELTPKQRD